MKSYVVLAAVAVAAGLVAACGGGADGSTLGPNAGGGYGNQGSMGGDQTGNNNSSSSGNSSSSNNNGSSSNNNGAGSGNQSQPSAGPGSSGSAAHTYFVMNVYPSIENTCGGCHNNATDGSPKFLTAMDANTSYQSLDARGDIIVDPSQSLLLHHGSHDGGKAPSPTADQATTITTWLTQEMQERAGSAAPVNVLQKIGMSCLDQTKFDAIGFQNLRTTRRTNENANNCTGCDNAPCRTCHTGGDGGFYMAMGSSLDNTTFAQTQTPQYIVKYIGLNGTAPVASDAIKNKAAAVATGAPYTHPMFTIPATMQTALDEFVQDAVTKYQNKQCGQ